MKNDFTLALCKLQTSRLAMCQSIVSDAKQAPEWIQLMPAGRVEAFDGRKFNNPNPQGVVEAFARNGLDLPLDWEHASELVAPKGGKAPAAGWITALEVREGSIWGKISWTGEGERSVCSREYRYVSPGFYHNKQGDVVGLSSAGLTNKPALRLAELAREGEAMDPKLLELLGLGGDATAEQVVAAVQATLDANKQLQAQCDGMVNTAGTATASLQKELDSLKGKLADTDKQLATARAAVPGLDKFVPRSDYDVVIARVKSLEESDAQQLAVAHQQQVETEIEAAARAGKITPQTADFYRKQCGTADGLKLFREFVKVAPVVVSEQIVTGEVPKGGDKKALTSEERQFIATMGLTDDEFRAGAF